MEDNMAAAKSKGGTSQYWIILCGIVLFFLGLAWDVSGHGMESIMEDIKHAPGPHLLPLAGIGVIVIGLIAGWKKSR